MQELMLVNLQATECPRFCLRPHSGSEYTEYGLVLFGKQEMKRKFQKEDFLKEERLCRVWEADSSRAL